MRAPVGSIHESTAGYAHILRVDEGIDPYIYTHYANAPVGEDAHILPFLFLRFPCMRLMRRKILPEFSDRKFFPPLARRAFKGSLAKGS